MPNRNDNVGGKSAQANQSGKQNDQGGGRQNPSGGAQNQSGGQKDKGRSDLPNQGSKGSSGSGQSTDKKR